MSSRRQLATLHALSGGVCYYCRQPTIITKEKLLRRATRDHRVPRGRGGADDAANRVLACAACNSLKADLTEAEFEYEVAWAVEHGVTMVQRGGFFKPIAVVNGKARRQLALEAAKAAHDAALARWIAERSPEVGAAV